LKPLQAQQEEAIHCHFDSIMLRAPFWFIYLEQLFKIRGGRDNGGEEALRRRMDKMDPMTKAFLYFYHKREDKDISWKSLDRARERMEECECYPILAEYIEDYTE
jgi:hypothetical protein